MTSRSFLIACVLLGLASQPAHAQSATAPGSVEQLRTTLTTLIKVLVEQRTLTPAQAAEMLRASGIDPVPVLGPQAQAPAVGAEPAKPVVRVPFVPPAVYAQLREEVEKDVLAKARAEGFAKPGLLPDWISRISVYGDLRVRAQQDNFQPDNDHPILVDAFFQLPDGTTRNTTEDRTRLRVRARVGLDAHVAETFDAGLRIVTSSGGDNNNPVSTNVDTGRFNRRFGAAFDLAYARWLPSDTLTVSAGRIRNPYLSTDLIWANDLTFDGLAVNYRPRLSERWTGLVTVGAHPLRELEGSAFSHADDKWLYGLQLGARWQGTGHRFNLAASYYDFDQAEGRLNPAEPVDNTFFDETAPLVRQRGNTMFNIAYQSSPTDRVFGLASKFQVLAIGGSYDFTRFDPVRVSLSGEYLVNRGFDRDEILRRIGPAAAELPFDVTGSNGVDRKRNKGYRYAVQVGDPELGALGRWRAFAGYRYLERDAVPDAFTSTDYRLGGTDVKATFVGVNLGLERNTGLTLRYVTAKTIDNATRFAVDTWFLDLDTQF